MEFWRACGHGKRLPWSSELELMGLRPPVDYTDIKGPGFPFFRSNMDLGAAEGRAGGCGWWTGRQRGALGWGQANFAKKGTGDGRGVLSFASRI